MDNILLSAALAFIITFFAIPVIIQIAKDKKLFDEPDERKVHKTVIPTLGGLGIFAGFIMAFLVGTPLGLSTELQYFVAASVVIFFLGLKDDILVISASKKFIGQLIAAGILIRFAGVEITNMHGFLGIYEIPQFASITLSFFTIIVITNSFNLIDGVDGLAGSLGLLTTFIFGIYFYNIGQLTYAVMAFAMSGSVLSFLIYNFSPAKIFMGDTGSLLLGLVNSILVIKFINSAGITPGTIDFPAAPAIGFAILMVPLFDTLRVFGLRILDRRSPFSPDRNHVHHFLLDLGFSHKQITYTCVSVNAAFVAVAYFCRNMGTTAVVAILLFAALSLTSLLYYLRNRTKQAHRPVKHAETEIIKRHKVLGMVPESLEVE
ncbi:MAG: undecaprenyl/decaprenyl-phosphate alpha-N-acetylglucosaminyl 1-phosphate transferase [Rhizobacter sp.]|nr:undecaprenyl/decaprenyl-phosphate alpha-N-acetylglucosaminyl 1-phosphate transferase [Ferruginibacter sp.]